MVWVNTFLTGGGDPPMVLSFIEEKLKSHLNVEQEKRKYQRHKRVKSS